MIKKKKILITGASAGLGKDIAKYYDKKSYNLIFLGQ